MPRDMTGLSTRRNRRLQSDPTGPNGSRGRYCDICNKEFSRPTELKRHLTNTIIHNPSARKYECQYCGSLHTQKSNLKIHERIHLNEQKEMCSLPLNETQSALCDFKCSDPSSMTRHIYKVHASPFYDLSRDQMALPSWLARAMETRTETKARRVEPALARTPPLSSSSSPRSSPPRSSTDSGLCTPSSLSEELLGGQIKTSYFENNFVPKTNIDVTCGNRYPLPDVLTVPSGYQPIPHDISNAPDFTFDYHQYLLAPAPAPAFSAHHYSEGPSVSTSPALFQSTSGSTHPYITQDYNSGFSMPCIAPFRNQFYERNAIQDVDYFDPARLEMFYQFSTTNYSV